MENFEKLFESIKFRMGAVFSFKNLSIFACLCKGILLLIFGLAFCFIELCGVIFALFSCLPLVGIILNFTLCLLCDLLASAFFYVITLPNLISKKQNNSNCTMSKSQEVNPLDRNVYMPAEIKDELLPLLNYIANSYLGEDGEKIKSFTVLCMLSDRVSYKAILNFIFFLKYLDDSAPQFAKMEEIQEAVTILTNLLRDSDSD